MLPELLLVGCGEKQAGRVNRCIAIDINFDYIARSKVKFPKNIYIVADANKLPFRNESFGKIICTEVIEHVKSPKMVLNEMLRILKKKGKLDMSIPLNYSCEDLAKKFHAYKRDFYEGYHRYRFDIKNIKDLLGNLQVVRCRWGGKRGYAFWRILARVVNLFNLNVKINENGKVELISESVINRVLFNIFLKVIKVVASFSQYIFGRYTTLIIEIEK